MSGRAPDGSSQEAVPRGAATRGRVTILLAVYDGARFLAEQLDSLLAQTHDDWDLVASIDRSTDGSRELIEAFGAENPGRLRAVLDGPAQGFAENFRALLLAAPGEADYLAFCDQDDVWRPEKLAHQVALLAPHQGPALTFARTILCDETLAEIGRSPLFTKPPCFANALVQSIGGGNTIMVNRAGGARLRQAAALARKMTSHDWWSYQVMSGTGGVVIYDPEPMVLYRQHGRNVMGQNRTLAAKLARLSMLVDGTFRRWTDENLANLAPLRDALTPENRALFDTFRAYRGRGIWQRARDLRRLPLHRQTPLGHLVLKASLVLGRV